MGEREIFSWAALDLLSHEAQGTSLASDADTVHVAHGQDFAENIETLQATEKRAMAGRPKGGGFPYLAETLRRVGIKGNVWCLLSCQSVYITNEGPVVTQGAPLVSGSVDVPAFDGDALIRAL